MGKSTTIPIKEVRLGRARLKAMDPDERRLLIIMGHVSNDLMTAHRLLMYCINAPLHNHIQMVAGEAQAAVAMRFLMGIMREAWAVVDREVLRSPTLGPRYHAVMKRDFPSDREDLGKLRRYFGAGESKHVRRIRDRFAFHYSAHEWDLKDWESVPDESLVFYVARTSVNSFYEFSHEAVTLAMMVEVDEDPHKALDKLHDEVLAVSRWLLGVVHAIMHITLRGLSPDGKLPVKNHRVPACNPFRVRVPAFVDTEAQEPDT